MNEKKNREFDRSFLGLLVKITVEQFQFAGENGYGRGFNKMNG